MKQNLIPLLSNFLAFRSHLFSSTRKYLTTFLCLMIPLATVINLIDTRRPEICWPSFTQKNPGRRFNGQQAPQVYSFNTLQQINQMGSSSLQFLVSINPAANNGDFSGSIIRSTRKTNNIFKTPGSDSVRSANTGSKQGPDTCWEGDWAECNACVPRSV